MFPVLVFGLLNVANWLNGMRNDGFTGYELTWLRWIAIAVACGVASSDAPWASAIVMSLPAWAISYTNSLRFRLPFYWLEEYGSVYVVHLILVTFGYVLRLAIFLPMLRGLRGESRDMQGEAKS